MQRNIDHDVCSEMIPAAHVRAGDLVPGLGIVDAVLTPGLSGHGHEVLICAGEDALSVKWFNEVEVFAGLCGDCGETLDDCDNEGGHGA